MATVTLQKKTSLGPILMEVVQLTDLTDQDTFTTVIQNPKFAMAVEYDTDANNTVQAAVSGRTVTVHNPTTGGGSGKVAVLVFGF